MDRGNFGQLQAARDFLFERRTDYDGARRDFRWPAFTRFNFAEDWFDVIAANNDAEALRVLSDDGAATSRSFAELSCESKRIANFLRSLGMRNGDPVLLVMGNMVPLWESMLALIRLGAVIIPATPLLSASDISDRIERGGVRFVIAQRDYVERFEHGAWTGIVTDGVAPGWSSLDEARGFADQFTADRPTDADDPMMLYFTSGTTAKAKLVVHSHTSYPVGHLSTMYWIGLKRGDRHLNISSPGWAKHAWSCLFAPWLAEAAIIVLDHARFDVRKTLDLLVNEKITTFCAPPTVWRMLVQEDLAAWPVTVRELLSAGEPLNPEIIERIREAWGVTIRDGFGQTETSVMIANTPGQPVLAGKVGRPLPGFEVDLLDQEGRFADEGQIVISLKPARPVGLMAGYRENDVLRPLAGDYHLTGDIASRDADGLFTYIGRADDVFKSSDYRISPFELESALIEHPLVLEVAVVPSPDPVRLAVPKAFITLVPGTAPTAESARAILLHARTVLGPFKRIRRIEFADLPKTISGKIRRIELQRLERQRHEDGTSSAQSWTEDDLI
ncbi:AMP-binding protein [Sphingomonas sp. SRS2]|uniref:AMP-binding protein n=1 Tax=Sphingomonas sp. SRS2 TaxID=133190 RepID=UPI0006184357|nr:AMP-binding protein [Sphingomonas sp. SRS2]KKC25227.1 AMP-dependent synthetase [Sphingomonas sp. SRS2]